MLLFLPFVLCSQKNSVTTYYNNVSGFEATKASNFGIRYWRELHPKLKVGIGYDRQRNDQTNLFYSSFLFATVDGYLVVDRSISYVYTDNITINNLDFLVKYNVLKLGSKFSLSPTVGLTNQIIQTTSIPLVEIVDFQIVAAEEVIDTKHFLRSKLGLEFSYKLNSQLDFGIEVFHRGLLNKRDNLVLSNKITSTSSSIMVYGENGDFSTTGGGTSYSESNVYILEQIGFGVYLEYRF